MQGDARKVTLPNVIIPGAAKAGTTSLYHYLSRHPDVFLPRRKELMFFDALYYRGIDWYADHYRRANDAPVRMDISPTYMHHPRAAERIRELLPEARILMILREPVSRAFSHYVDLLGWSYAEGSFLDVLQNPVDVPRGKTTIRFDILEMSLYGKHVERFQTLFGPARVKLLLFDTLKNDREAFFHEIFDFLAVRRPTPEELGADTVHHSRRVNRNKRLGKLLNSEGLREFARIAVPDFLQTPLRRLYEGIQRMNAGTAQLPVMTELEHDTAREYFARDVEHLKTLTDLDLSGWGY